MSDEDFILVLWLLKSRYRVEILQLLNKKSLNPTFISKKINISVSSVSRTLKLLKEKELIRYNKKNKGCKKKYVITDDGRRILSLLCLFS